MRSPLSGRRKRDTPYYAVEEDGFSFSSPLERYGLPSGSAQHRYRRRAKGGGEFGFVAIKIKYTDLYGPTGL